MTEWIETIESSWGANKRVYRISGRSKPAAWRATHRLPSVAGFSLAALAAPVAEYYEFDTEAELHSIEVAARWARNTDFRRFFMDRYSLMVEFESGMTAFSGLQVEPIPSQEEEPMTAEPKLPQTPTAESMALRAAENGMAAAQEMGAAHVVITVFANDGSYQTRWVGSALIIQALARFAHESAEARLGLMAAIAKGSKPGP